MDQEWIELALNRWTIFYAGGIFFLLRTLKTFKPLDQNGLYRRLLPFMPEVLGLAGAFFGALPVVDGQPLPLKLAAGLWCAYLAKGFRKFLAQTVLGIDQKLEAGQKPAGELAADLLDRQEKGK